MATLVTVGSRVDPNPLLVIRVHSDVEAIVYPTVFFVDPSSNLVHVPFASGIRYVILIPL